MEQKTFLQDFIDSLISSIKRETRFDEFLKVDTIINRLKNEEINVLIVGETGVGKSSTISALFGGSLIDKIDCGQKPMTMEIEKYSLGNLIIWDTPGLGDNTEKDEIHAEKIEKLLKQKNAKGEFLIDVVLVIVNASNRAMDSTFKIIKNVVRPNMKDENIVIGVNKIDLALDNYWDRINNCPVQEPKVLNYLEEKIILPINKRIKEEIGINLNPVYYTAGSMDIFERRQKPGYNLKKLFSIILKATPLKKRLGYTEKLNKEENVWKANDSERNYGEEIKNTLLEALCAYLIKEFPIVANKLLSAGKKLISFLFK